MEGSNFMNTLEALFVILGISLDVFAVMECHGSLVATIHKKQLAAFCILLMLGQGAALGAGNSISLLLYENRTGVHEALLGQVVATAIFLCLGMRLFLKAWRNERLDERREEKLNLSETARLYVRTLLFTLLAGLAFGLLQSSITSLLAMILAFTVIGTILGTYTGYRLGFEHKAKAYIAGGALLIAGGMDVALRYIWKII